MKYNIETELETDNRWIAEITNIAGAIAYGATKAEAIDAVTKLADQLVKLRKEKGYNDCA